MRTDVGGKERVPVSLFFRDVDAMGPVERRVLLEAKGKVLDLGAGAGALAVPLMRAGLEVTALEILPQALAALREAGVPDVRSGGVEALEPRERFDTVLALMNGLGLPGTLAALDDFLVLLERRMERGGMILADSTDPSGWDEPGDGRYVGEVHMQLEYGGRAGEPFPFLFVDPDTLTSSAGRAGLSCDVLEREDDGRYLVRMSRLGAR